MKLKRWILPAVMGVIAAAVCFIAPQALLRSLGDIAANFFDEDITQVIAQLEHAAITTPFWTYLGCGAAIMLIMRLLRRQWLGAAIICLHLVVAGALISVWYTRVNSIPVHTMLKILADYALSGALW